VLTYWAISIEVVLGSADARYRISESSFQNNVEPSDPNPRVGDELISVSRG